MRLRLMKLLEDIRQAIEAIRHYCRARSYEEFASDRLLRSAVEREFIIIGEALIRIRDQSADLFGKIPDVRRIIGFRHVLVHGYDVVDTTVVWNTIQNDLPTLETVVRGLLRELESEGSAGEGHPSSPSPG